MHGETGFSRPERDYWRNQRYRTPSDPPPSVPVVMLHRSAYDRLQRIEAAARAMEEPNWWVPELQQYMCVYCGVASFAVPGPHAPDCPWLVLQNVLTEERTP